MSSCELERVEVMGRVGSGDLKLRDAAVMLELSYRQTKRRWRRYRRVGSKGLKHGNAGRPSNHSKPLKLRRRVLNLIRGKYSGSEEERFGPTLAAEHSAEEDGLVMDHETLRRWMLAERRWSRPRKGKKHCQRRERKSHFGELVQLDGSFHAKQRLCRVRGLPAFYSADNLPTEEVLTADLHTILELYETLRVSENLPIGTGATEDDEEDNPNLRIDEDLRKFREHKRIERSQRLARKGETDPGVHLSSVWVRFFQGLRRHREEQVY